MVHYTHITAEDNILSFSSTTDTRLHLNFTEYQASQHLLAVITMIVMDVFGSDLLLLLRQTTNCAGRPVVC